MKYRKRPVIVEAHQFDHTNATSLAEWCGGTVNGDVITIGTLEGDMIAQLGDYIIRGVQGEHYPCKPDIFDATYEHAPDFD